MKGAIEVMKHMGENGDPEVMWKMESIIKNLKQKEEDLEGLEALSRSLIKKERESNDELQAARNELISVSFCFFLLFFLFFYFLMYRIVIFRSILLLFLLIQ